jgi:4-amino-4-deoxy-L-arabinose transferase-like glycosyltransferase
LNASNDIPAPTISLQRCLLLFAAVLLLAVPQAALLPLLDRDEPRFAEAAREMIQSGNFVVPTFNGVPRYDKPPLIYWCQAVAYEAFGESAFAARLPSLIATAATAVLIYTWGVRLGREWIGLAGALCYAFCLQTVQQGRVATADALLIFFMTLTAFAGWLVVRPRSGGRVPLACYLVLALGFAGGFLAKGPEAWLPLVALLWCGRGRRTGVVLGFVGGLAIVLIWGAPAYVETHGDYLWLSWKAGIQDRLWGSDQGHGASSLGAYVLELPYYILLFWISALPWSVLILMRGRKLFSGWTLDLADTYLLLNVVPLFVIFTLMATKLPHYTLPAFPMLALLFARRWVAAQLSPSLPLRLMGGFALGFALLAFVGVPLAVENGFSPSPVGKLVREAGETLKPETQFALVDFKEPTAVWEMRRVCKGYGQLVSWKDLSSFMAGDGSRAVILTPTGANLLEDVLRKDAESHLAQSGGLPDLKTFQIIGFNAAKGQLVDLVLVVKP